MKRSLTDILIFQTPFEDKEIFEKKYKKIQEMLEDYITNSWIELKKTKKENTNYEIFLYSHDILDIHIELSRKKIFGEIDFYPAIMVSYFLNEFKFEKQNIENFLNDNIKFIANMYFDDFFIDFDNKYNICDINKGKKVDYKNLKKFDKENAKSKHNKLILDSMMYLYFSLIKNIFEINSNSDTINLLIEKKSSEDLRASLELFSLKQNSFKESLIQTATKLKTQIEAFITLIS